MKIKRADKIFIIWKKLKCVILMCILNMLLRQIMMTKTQDTAFNYAKILKMRSNLIIKAVLKWIKHEIMILWYECSSLDREEIKSAKIVKTMNTKIKDNDKEKMIAVRKLLSEDIILMLNSVETKTHMIKKTDWASTLELKTCVIRTCFMIMIKHVIRNVISQSD